MITILILGSANLATNLRAAWAEVFSEARSGEPTKSGERRKKCLSAPHLGTPNFLKPTAFLSLSNQQEVLSSSASYNVQPLLLLPRKQRSSSSSTCDGSSGLGHTFAKASESAGGGKSGAPNGCPHFPDRQVFWLLTHLWLPNGSTIHGPASSRSSCSSKCSPYHHDHDDDDDGGGGGGSWSSSGDGLSFCEYSDELPHCNDDDVQSWLRFLRARNLWSNEGPKHTKYKVQERTMALGGEEFSAQWRWWFLCCRRLCHHHLASTNTLYWSCSEFLKDLDWQTWRENPSRRNPLIRRVLKFK